MNFPGLLSTVTETTHNLGEGTHIGTNASINDDLEKPEEEKGKRIFMVGLGEASRRGEGYSQNSHIVCL